MIHSHGAVLPQYTKTYFEQIATADKKLHWMDTELESPFHQFSYYDLATMIRNRKGRHQLRKQGNGLERSFDLFSEGK